MTAGRPLQEGTSLKPGSLNLTEDCRRISDILSRVGDKWTVLVVGQLRDGPVRFKELQRRIGGISQKMLTATLRGLERDGFVIRTVFPTVPPRVEYGLTPLGQDIIRPLRGLEEWARENAGEVEEARRRFDAKAGGRSRSAA